jgi:hypothetical protein
MDPAYPLRARVGHGLANGLQDLGRQRGVIDGARDQDAAHQRGERGDRAAARVLTAAVQALELVEVALDLLPIGRADTLVGAGNVGPERHDRAALGGVVAVLRGRVPVDERRQRVVGVHVGYVDTDLTAGLDVDKVAPELVATAALDALEAGESEALVDDFSRTVKSALHDDHNLIYPGIADRFDATVTHTSPQTLRVP